MWFCYAGPTSVVPSSFWELERHTAHPQIPQYRECAVCLACHPRAPCQAVGTVSTCSEHACWFRRLVRCSTAQTADTATPTTSVWSKPATVSLSPRPQQSCDYPLIAYQEILTSCLQSN